MILETEKIKKVLVINAHADDMEFGCGSTVAKLIEQGKEVHNLVLSLRKKTVPPDFPAAELIRETKQAGRIIGIKEENNIIKDYPHRIFPSIRQQILDEIYSTAEKLKPDLVFTTSQDDTHQDHQTTAQETFRALKHTNIIAYGFPWNTIFHRLNLYSIVSQEHLNKKIKALSQYKSQHLGRVYFSPDYIVSLAKTQGVNVNAQFAESFEIIRWISH